MSLEELQRNWEAFGKSDPLRAILGHPTSWDVDQFFATGVAEIDNLLGQLGEFGLEPGRSTALDFGCGVGRLTQALARHFRECHGVDIAAPMVELARQYNTYEDRCIYHLNQSSNLEIFEDERFDFIYSNITLQHMEPIYAEGYLREFVRVLGPGGVLAFQLPDRVAARPLAPEAYRAALGLEEERLVAVAGSRLDVAVRVENRSSLAWPSDQLIRLGNHWLDATGAMLQRDDGRVALPVALGPGKSVDLSLPVAVPALPGHYVLELDLVQEGVAWFKKHGSPTARIPVEVTPSEESQSEPQSEPKLEPNGPTEPAASEPAQSSSPRPRMLMFATPRDQVVAWITSAGGKVVGVKPCSAARGWNSYLYFATKE